jgi:hypothetical protein
MCFARLLRRCLEICPSASIPPWLKKTRDRALGNGEAEPFESMRDFVLALSEPSESEEEDSLSQFGSFCSERKKPDPSRRWCHACADLHGLLDGSREYLGSGRLRAHLPRGHPRSRAHMSSRKRTSRASKKAWPSSRRSRLGARPKSSRQALRAQRARGRHSSADPEGAARRGPAISLGQATGRGRGAAQQARAISSGPNAISARRGRSLANCLVRLHSIPRPASPRSIPRPSSREPCSIAGRDRSLRRSHAAARRADARTARRRESCAARLFARIATVPTGASWSPRPRSCGRSSPSDCGPCACPSRTTSAFSSGRNSSSWSDAGLGTWDLGLGTWDLGLGLGRGVHCGGCAQAGSAPASLDEKMRTASSQG